MKLNLVGNQLLASKFIVRKLTGQNNNLRDATMFILYALYRIYFERLMGIILNLFLTKITRNKFLLPRRNLKNHI